MFRDFKPNYETRTFNLNLTSITKTPEMFSVVGKYTKNLADVYSIMQIEMDTFSDSYSNNLTKFNINQKVYVVENSEFQDKIINLSGVSTEAQIKRLNKFLLLQNETFKLEYVDNRYFDNEVEKDIYEKENTYFCEVKLNSIKRSELSNSNNYKVEIELLQLTNWQIEKDLNRNVWKPIASSDSEYTYTYPFVYSGDAQTEDNLVFETIRVGGHESASWIFETEQICRDLKYELWQNGKMYASGQVFGTYENGLKIVNHSSASGTQGIFYYEPHLNEWKEIGRLNYDLENFFNLKIGNNTLILRGCEPGISGNGIADLTVYENYRLLAE